MLYYYKLSLIATLALVAGRTNAGDASPACPPGALGIGQSGGSTTSQGQPTQVSLLGEHCEILATAAGNDACGSTLNPGDVTFSCVAGTSIIQDGEISVPQANGPTLVFTQFKNPLKDTCDDGTAIKGCYAQ